MQIHTKVIFMGNELMQSQILDMLPEKNPTSITRASCGVDVYQYGPYYIWNLIEPDTRYYTSARIVFIFDDMYSQRKIHEESIYKVEPSAAIYYMNVCQIDTVKRILKSSDN